MQATKNKHSGAIEVIEVIDSQLVRRVYYFMTERQAKKAFREEFPLKRDHHVPDTTRRTVGRI
jgi:hypothetical protein